MERVYSRMSKFSILLLFAIMLFAPKVYAAGDTVSTLANLQTAIDTSMHARQTSLSINYTGNSTTVKTDISNVINNIYNADDYLHYTSKGYSYSYTVSGGVTSINFTFAYWNTAAQDSYVSSKVTEILNQIITPGMNDFEKQKVIHDWIEKNVAYDTTLVKHSDYDALASPYKTVCQGYALLSYKMLNQAGIQTKIIEGTAGGQAHAWNLVNLNGSWYHFDTTWDDPLPDVAGRVTYGYYNLTDAQIKKDHTWVKFYPAANTDFNTTLASQMANDPVNAAVYQDLYNSLGLNLLTAEYTANDAVGLNAKIQEAIKNNQNSIKIRYMKGSTLATDLTTAIKGISNIYGYSYSKSDCVRSSDLGDVILNLSFNYSVPVSVSSVTLSNNSLTLNAGTSGTLAATVLPSNASNKTIIWSTSDPTVVTVSGGIVKAVGGGTATITATTADGGFKAESTVKVIQGVSSVSLSAPTHYVRLWGEDVALSAIVNPVGATDKSLTWKSSNPNVATVDSNGKVHAVAFGNAVIYATSVQNTTKIGSFTVTVPIPVTNVSILSPSSVVKMGSALSLKAVYEPANATIKTSTWSSSDTSIAKVSSTGVVTPVAPGSVTIIAVTTDGSLVATQDLKVIYGVTSVTLDKKSAYLKLGETDLSLTATVNPSNATDKSLTWKSSNPNVATVDANGNVHAVAYGTATISAVSVQDTTKIANCTVIVPVPVTGVSISSSSNIIKMGSTLSLTTVFTPINPTNKTVTWTSSNPAVAKVSATGIVTPVAPGSVTITVTTTDGGFTAMKELKVVYPVTTVTLNKTTAALKVGAQDFTLIATVNPSTATDKSVTWKSSNSNVGTVDSIGNVHIVGVGSVVITVTSVQDPTKYAKCTITVTN